MSDLARNRGEPVAQGLAKVLQAAVNQKKNEKSDLPEDFNTLVLPDTQDIGKTQINWHWIVKPDEEFQEISDGKAYVYVVCGRLFTKGSLKGQYFVSVWTTTPDHLHEPEETQDISFAGNESKNVGRALISAWNYHNVWKDHAGYFIEKEVMTEDD